MPYVITQNCCSDASCLTACPVGCIHPTPDEPGFGAAEILHIDPHTCINCGACADACPIGAIVPDTDLRGDQRWFAEVNAGYYADHPTSPRWERREVPGIHAGVGGLRVAIVGSGAAAWYAARSLLRHPGVEVTMLDKLPVPGGLIRYGVAPDHPETKSVTGQFRWMRGQQQRFHLHLGVEVGTDVDHSDLMRHHHAVIYAHGAQHERPLAVPGEELTVGALAFVGWYNDHPDHRSLSPDLTGRRVVIVGNGNVALDMARILAAPPQTLTATGMAPHALAALRASRVEEVVICGRRGVEHASFTAAELHGLMQTPGVQVVVDAADLAAAPGSPKADLLRTAAGTGRVPGARRIVLRFGTEATEITRGDGGLDVVLRGADGRCRTLEATLMLRAIGFRGGAIDGVPFCAETHTIPNDGHRVIDPRTGEVRSGVYATGWAARGPHGGIGVNRTCAEGAVETLMADFAAGTLEEPVAGGFAEFLHTRCPSVCTIDHPGGYADAWQRAARVAEGGRPTGRGAESGGARRGLLPLWHKGPLRSRADTGVADGATS